MRAYINYEPKLKAYSVQCYMMVGSEQYPSWHILRLFSSPGEASMFRDMVNKSGRYEQYAKTFDANRIVRFVNIDHNGNMKLIFE